MTGSPFIALPSGVRRVSVPSPVGQLATLQINASVPTRRGIGRQGFGASSPTVVLVPGFTGSKEDFISILPLLSTQGLNSVALDLRGQYESIGPDSPDAYGLTGFAQDVDAVVRHVSARASGPIHLVGHSFGGLVARQAVLSNCLTTPSWRKVRSLTLLSSGPAAVPSQMRPLIEALLAALPHHSLAEIYQWGKSAETDRAHHGPIPDDAMENFLATRFTRSSPASLTAQARILLSEIDRTDQLRAAATSAGLDLSVTCGSLDDRWSPQTQAEMAERLNAPFRTVPGCGHSPANEDPPATVEALVSGWSR